MGEVELQAEEAESVVEAAVVAAMPGFVVLRSHSSRTEQIAQGSDAEPLVLLAL